MSGADGVGPGRTGLPVSVGTVSAPCTKAGSATGGPAPPIHAFRVRSSLVLLDLAELEAVLGAVPLCSVARTGPERAAHGSRLAPLQFRRVDYLDGTDRPLGGGPGRSGRARTGTRPDRSLSGC